MPCVLLCWVRMCHCVKLKQDTVSACFVQWYSAMQMTPYT
jgi:hypothetical protein